MKLKNNVESLEEITTQRVGTKLKTHTASMTFM